MESHDLPEKRQHQCRRGKREDESDERYGKSRVGYPIEGFPESGSPGGLSEIDFRSDAGSGVSGRSYQHEEVGDVFSGDGPHPLHSKLFGISGDRKRQEVPVPLVGHVDFLSGKRGFFRRVRRRGLRRLHSRDGFEEFGRTSCGNDHVVGFLEVFAVFFEKRGIVFRSRNRR